MFLIFAHSVVHFNAKIINNQQLHFLQHQTGAANWADRKHRGESKEFFFFYFIFLQWKDPLHCASNYFTLMTNKSSGKTVQESESQ